MGIDLDRLGRLSEPMRHLFTLADFTRHPGFGAISKAFASATEIENDGKWMDTSPADHKVNVTIAKYVQRLEEADREPGAKSPTIARGPSEIHPRPESPDRAWGSIPLAMLATSLADTRETFLASGTPARAGGL